VVVAVLVENAGDRRRCGGPIARQVVAAALACDGLSMSSIARDGVLQNGTGMARGTERC